MNIDKFLQETARKHGVSVEEVKCEIQDAIDDAYKSPTAAAKKVPCKGKIPTIEEFILYLLNQTAEH